MNHTHKKPLPGTTLHYIDARAAVDALSPGAWARMPYTARVHAENLVRRADPAQLDSYLLQLIERRRDIDFPWYPVRVVCHDILGQTALVDLAGLRDAIAAEGGDPAQVNPVVPVQLIVDHSLAVECGGFEQLAIDMTQADDSGHEDREEHHQRAEHDDRRDAVPDPQHENGGDCDGGQRLGCSKEGLHRRSQQAPAVDRVR